MVDYIYGKIYDTLRTLKVAGALEVVARFFFFSLSLDILAVLKQTPTSGWES